MKQPDDALLDSQKLLNDKYQFRSMKGVTSMDCEQELDKVFEETSTERKIELLR